MLMICILVECALKQNMFLYFFRFLLSVVSCRNALVIDDELKVLPVSTNFLNIKPLPPKSADDDVPAPLQQLNELKESFQVRIIYSTTTFYQFILI